MQRTRILAAVFLATAGGLALFEGIEHGVSETLGTHAVVLLFALAATLVAYAAAVRFDRLKRRSEMAERELSEKNRIFDLIAGHLPSVLWVCTPTIDRMVYVSPAYEKIWGRSCQSLYDAPRSFTDPIHPDDRDGVFRKLATVAGGEWDLEYRIIRSDGAVRWVRDRGYPVLGAGGGVELMAGIATDVTERKHIEETLRDQEERFRLVLDNALVGIVTADDHGTVHTMNRAAEEIFGYEAGEVEGRDVSILMPEPHRSAHAGYLAAYRESRVRNVVGSSREVEGQRKDGSVFPIQLAVSATRVGEREFFTAIVRDISKRKKAERDMIEAKHLAEAANVAKSEFLASMSHELRTPLNAILGFADTIRAGIFGPLGNERYQSYVDDIHRSGEHLLELINDILDVSAIEAGRMELHEDRIAIPAVVESSIRLVRPRAEAQGLTLRTEIREDLPRLWADERRLRQVLLNLLSNAVKFTPDSGIVTLAAHQDDQGRVVFDITDTGIGMAPGDVEKALTPFGQVDSSLARKYEGTGLGLPLTVALVDLHGGTFAIDSREGEGTRVTVSFPADRVVDGEEAIVQYHI